MCLSVYFDFVIRCVPRKQGRKCLMVKTEPEKVISPTATVLSVTAMSVHTVYTLPIVNHCMAYNRIDDNLH